MEVWLNNEVIRVITRHGVRGSLAIAQNVRALHPPSLNVNKMSIEYAVDPELKVNAANLWIFTG